MFLNTNHPTLLSEKASYAQITYQESNANYNEIIREVAAESQVELNDVKSFSEEDWSETGKIKRSFASLRSPASKCQRT